MSWKIAPALAAHPHLGARVVEPIADAGGPTARAHDGDRRDRHRHVLVDDPRLHGLANLALVLLDPVDAVDDDLALARHGAHDLALLAAVLAGQHPDPVALLDLHQRTSGAREMMRMKRLSRSSRPTGPKMRVPRGWSWSLISTAAFSSKRMYDPSGRRFSFLVRTTTHFTTSPFFTAAPGMASLTVATKMSPIDAYRRLEPPNTLMQSTSLAPELSATRSRDSCWITGPSR